MYEDYPESKERLCIQSAYLFCCSRSLVSGVQCDAEKLPHAVVCKTLSHGKCRDSCGYYSIQSGPGTWDFFLFSKMREHLAGKCFANYKDVKDAVVIWLNNQVASWNEEGIHKLVPRCVPKLVYSVSVLLLKNILVWRNILYFMDDLHKIISKKEVNVFYVIMIVLQIL